MILRIKKKQAEKQFNQGNTLKIVPCKLSHINKQAMLINNTMGEFNKIIADYAFSHCNKYSGKRLSYYIHKNIF